MRLGGVGHPRAGRFCVSRAQMKPRELELQQLHKIPHRRGRSERHHIEPFAADDAGIQAASRLVVLEKHCAGRERLANAVEPD